MDSTYNIELKCKTYVVISCNVPLQARAPHSPVLIVGTHLDKLHFNRAQDLKQKYKEKIKSLYGKAGFPSLSA